MEEKEEPADYKAIEGTASSKNDTKKEDSGHGNEPNDENVGGIDLAFEEDKVFQAELKSYCAWRFEKLLDIDDLFRKKTREYLATDVHGPGCEFQAISRPFIGWSDGSSSYHDDRSYVYGKVCGNSKASQVSISLFLIMAFKVLGSWVLMFNLFLRHRYRYCIKMLCNV